MLSRLLFDSFGLFYAISLVFLFIDAVQPRRVLNRTALLLLFVVFAAETGLLMWRLARVGSVYSPFDAMLLVSWLILVVALVVDTVFRVDLLLFFANFVAFALVAFDVFAHQGRIMYTTHPGDLLVLHVSLALMSYVAFSFAFVFSFMYLIQDRFLREKKWTGWYFRLPSLERLDMYIFRSVIIGFPLLLVAMVLGAIWSKITLGHVMWVDPKPIATEFLWVLYGVYLVLRLRSGWGGGRLVWYSVVCFTGVILNFLVVGSFSIFHHTAAP